MKRTHICLALTAHFTTLYSIPVLANTTEVERIEVTGSRINRTDMETASSVTVISSEMIVKAGYQSIEEILSNQTASAGMNLGATSNNGSGGSATVNLRGMGTERTLVLLNGRRMVASGTGADASVDLNTIPIAMIKSIEILKDGASAVYGSDAIAGVVNIITKKDYEGTEINIDGSQTTYGDGTSYGVSLLHGMQLGEGNLVIGAQFSERGDVSQGDRDYIPEGCSSFVPEGSLGGKVPDGNGGFKDRDSCYDYTDLSYAQTPNNLYSFFSSYNNEIATDTDFSIDLMYTRRDSNQQMAPQPASIDLTVCEPGAGINTDCIIAPNDPEAFIPGQPLDTIEYRRRMEDAGPRIYEQETDTYRASIGLTGILNNDAQWNMSATYGRNDSVDQVQNSIHAGNMENSIYNNQALWLSGDPIDRDFLIDEGVIYTEQNKGGNEQFIMAAGYSGITDSDIGYAVGIENRFESGYYKPDERTQKGESTAAQQDPTQGDYSVQSVYLETAMPILDAINLEGAIRYDNYSTFGGASTWKLGATWKASDVLMLRTVAATGFRAPSVSELYGGDVGSFDYLADPWGNEQDAQILVNWTSDENLQPEESESFTFGLVWEIADGLSTTIDYWAFDITDAISRLDVQNEMNKCYDGDLTACEAINITPEGDLSEMTSPLTNVGSQKTSGIDWNVSFLGDQFKVKLDTTYLLEFEQDGVDYTGRIDGNNGGYSELKSNLSVGYDFTDDFNVQYMARYIHGMDGSYYGDDFSTDSVIYHDVSSTYHFESDIRMTAGVKNLFDTHPEEVPGGNDMGTVPGIYDVVGRTLFINLQYRF